MPREIDVFILEDDDDYRRLLGTFMIRRAPKRLVEIGSCQDDLTRFLQGNKAKLYMIDDNYPEKARGVIQYKAPEGIEKVRQVYPDAQIVLFSDKSEEEIKSEVERLNVDYRRKISAAQDVDYITKKLEELEARVKK